MRVGLEDERCTRLQISPSGVAEENLGYSLQTRRTRGIVQVLPGIKAGPKEGDLVVTPTTLATVKIV